MILNGEERGNRKGTVTKGPRCSVISVQMIGGEMHDGKTWSVEARVVKTVATRSHDVMTPEGVTSRRNRRHVFHVPECEQTDRHSCIRPTRAACCNETVR